MHLCSALLKFTTYIYNIYSWLQLSIYNSFRLSLKNKKMVKLEHPVLCIVFHLKPLKKAQSSQHHISFHLFQPNHLSKSLSSFQAEHYLISHWWLETTLQAQVLVAGPEKGSLLIYSHDISQIYYECVYAELQNCLCHLAIASLSDASRVYFKRKNSIWKKDMNLLLVKKNAMLEWYILSQVLSDRWLAVHCRIQFSPI